MARAGCSGSSTTSHTPASRTANAAKAKAATKSAMAASHGRLTPEYPSAVHGRTRWRICVEPDDDPADSVILFSPLATPTRNSRTSEIPLGNARSASAFSPRVWRRMSRTNAALAGPTLVEAALRFPGSRESWREFNSRAWALGDDAFKK